MRISAQINVLLTIAAVLVPVTVGITLFSIQNVAHKMADIRAAEDLVYSTTQLRQVAVETALYNETRAQEQWLRKIVSVQHELDKKVFVTPRDQTNIDRIRNKLELMQIIYPRLIRAPYPLKGKFIASQTEADAAALARAVASLLVVTEEVMDICHDVIHSNREEAALALRTMQLSINILLPTMLILMAFIWYLISRRILRPLRVFELGAQQVSTGNYSHRLKLRQHDEIGELAQAFDSMIMRVEQAAEELGNHRNNLAALVVTKTAELEEAKDAAETVSQYARSLIEASLDPLVTINTEGQITDANKATELVTGKDRDTLIGSDFADNFTEPQKARAGYQQFFAQGTVTDYPLTVQHATGAITAVLYNASVYLDSKGRVAGVFATARDVTEHRRLFQVLEKRNVELQLATSVAEKANLAKSNFLSSMSHELRTPLNAILGFAQLLEISEPPPTAMQIESLNQIIQAGWYLLELINEILDLAVIESGKLALTQEPVLLVDVMQECQAMIETQAQEAGIRLEILPFDHSWLVEADRTRVKQIVINLLSNAIKYNRPSGTVEVACTAINHKYLRISIKDSGAGISAEHMQQLFQPFNRLGQEDSSEEGTGIGLALSKRLVELMGGTVGVTSTLGVGSEFWFELPRVDGA